MTTELLNNKAYEIDADNLVLAVGYPMLHRSITVTNTKEDLKRGMAVVNVDGTLYIAGAQESSNIVAVIAADHAADTASDTVSLDAYVSGAFNIGEVKTVNDLDISTAACIFGAQGNGIYLL